MNIDIEKLSMDIDKHLQDCENSQIHYRALKWGIFLVVVMLLVNLVIFFKA